MNLTNFYKGFKCIEPQFSSPLDYCILQTLTYTFSVNKKKFCYDKYNS